MYLKGAHQEGGAAAIESTFSLSAHEKDNYFSKRDFPMFPVFWLTVGCGYYTDTFKMEKFHRPFYYGETGVWLILNLGVGYTFGDPDFFRTPHLYMGLPIPLGDPVDSKNNTFFFIEPYARLRFLDEKTYEYGIMFKIAVNPK
jgi:hypothetical protein